MSLIPGLNLNVNTGQVQMVVITIITLLIVCGIGIAIFFWVRHKKRYGQFSCVIWEKDSLGNRIEKIDKAGIFLDKKSGNKLFRSWKYKIKVDPDLVHYHYKGNNKVAYFLQTGINVFKPVKINISDNPGITYKLGEVDINWGLDEFNRYARIYQTQSLFLQYLPYMMVAVAGIIIIIMIYIVLQKFDVLASVAESLKAAASEINMARSGTTVIQGTTG